MNAINISSAAGVDADLMPVYRDESTIIGDKDTYSTNTLRTTHSRRHLPFNYSCVHYSLLSVD